MWVLRSTITLKTTDTTLVSVDGNIGHRGALAPLPHASPDTRTEETTSATVTLLAIPWTWEVETGKVSVVTELRTKSWHRSKPLSVANIKLTGLCKLCTQVCIYFGVFYNSRNYADPHFRAVRTIIPF